MKNKLLSFIIIGLCVFPMVSFALTTSVKTIKDEIEAKKEAIKKDMASKTDAIKESVEARRQNVVSKILDRISQFVGNIITRYDAAVNRLEILSDRINSRITKMEAKNIDVAKAKELIAVAKTKIEIAKTSTDNITNNIASSTATTTVALKEEYQVVKSQIEKAKEDIKSAHSALVDVVNNLKPGQNKLEN